MRLTLLTQLARRLELSPRALLTRLRAVDAVRGKRSLIIVQAKKQSRIWVNEDALRKLQQQSTKDVDERLRFIEQRLKAVEVRLDDVEDDA